MKRRPTLWTASCLLIALAESPLRGEEDPYLWLEEIDSERALAWVESKNDKSSLQLEAVPEYEGIHERALEILSSEDRIPYPDQLGDLLYNFWQDGKHQRGLWRRTTLAEYRKEEPQWETVLDLDALSEATGERWVWKGATCFYPEYRRCILSLSPGGGDATVSREFDTVLKDFVDGGFELPKAKSSLSWKDADHVWVGTDFGEGSLTDSGYPRIGKLWKRGTPLQEAVTVVEGAVGDVAAGIGSTHVAAGRYDIARITETFYSGTSLIRLGERLVKLDFPDDHRFRGMFQNNLMLSLRSDWEVGGEVFPQGSLLSIDLDRFLAGGRDFDILFQPRERVSLLQVATTRNKVLVNTLDNVRGRLVEMTLEDGVWSERAVDLPKVGSIGVVSTSDLSDQYFVTYTDYLTPSTLYLVADGRPEALKSLPAFFDNDGLEVVQHQATSEDGTKIPYFAVHRKDLELDGSHPTLMYGYGGFQVSVRPRYSATVGSSWLEKGGVYVVANIRGGGEFGPSWHQAALLQNRHKAYDDFIAIAEDLISRKITSAEHLGITGGSNGGLLVGAAVTRRPDLFGAVVCKVPLLDMKRYTKLLAGASWAAEYGDPDDPEMWEYIRTYSPYHNVSPDAEYPEIFVRTSTRDDRVHPAHARKMVALMEAHGHPVLYYENTEGGHAGASTPAQRAYADALDYAYLWRQLR